MNLTENKVNKAYFGEYGGCFVPPILESKLNHLQLKFDELRKDQNFNKEYINYLKNYVGRPSPLYFAKNLSKLTGNKIYLKREDLNHTGAHKINNTIGQILVAKSMGAQEIIAETGAGQHGVASATAAALMGMKCKIFMGKVDTERQALNVVRMQLLGAEVITTHLGNGTLKDAVDAALGYYIENPDSYYLLGSAVGPHPYPQMVKFFQSIIGKEIKEQFYKLEKKLPDAIIACVGGGSNAIGAFAEFLNHDEVMLLGAEGGGTMLTAGNHAATLTLGKKMIFQGANSLCLANENGEASGSYSIAAGLDYPGIGPEHAHLKETKRATYYPISDKEAIDAYKLLSRTEGIIPAIESAHAVALALKTMNNKNKKIVINVSGRGDKDVDRLDQSVIKQN
ncbi:MAG: tryptophan synthase subunit beta [Marinilabiliales bacterium]|nr:MAG: tryptophan synthase subunit beta [Marinilabiliales bacterium]